LFRCSVAICHSPQYELDNRDGLAQDWARLPLPRSAVTARELFAAGNTVSQLLDPHSRADFAIQRVIADQGRSLARLERVDGGSIRENDLVVEYSYYGSAAGRWEHRGYLSEENAHLSWGESTGDLYMSSDICFRNIPERVWKYELGGYPVLKKWLGYRDRQRRPGHSLTLAEVEHFRSMARRIAALLVFHSTLDRLYEQCLADFFPIDELSGL
jgi:hypothetical protein